MILQLPGVPQTQGGTPSVIFPIPILHRLRLKPALLAGVLVWVSVVLLFPITNAADFRPVDIQKILNGELISHTVEVPGKPWPEIYVFLLIPGPSIDAFAVIHDVESEKKFYSELTESKIVNRIDLYHRDVHFIQTMPWPLSNESYVVRQTIENPSPNTFLLNWVVISASSTKEGRGFALFEPFSNATLMTYKNFVEPGYAIASFPLVRRLAISQVQDVSKKMSARIQSVRKKDPAKLKILRENVYKLFPVVDK